MENVANTAPATTGGKKSLTERAFGELEKYAIIIVYLWLLFGLFSLHKQLVQGHGISLWHQGFAILNALIFGKVILIGQALKVGKGLERRELIWTVLGRSCCKASTAYSRYAAVCRVEFKPISGYEPDDPNIKVMSHTDSIEVWLVSVTGTDMYVPYHLLLHGLRLTVSNLNIIASRREPPNN